MANIVMLIAVIILAIAGLCGVLMKPSWRAVTICWSLLALGATIFGIALTL